MVTHLTYVHHSILLHADIHESTKGGDVGHDPGKPHAGAKVVNLLHPFCKGEYLEFLAGVPARFCKFGQDVG